jgi:Ca2+-binding EF-hand superfamily protein
MMKLKLLAALLTGSLIGMTLTTAGFAQDDERRFGGPGREGRGMMPGTQPQGQMPGPGMRGAGPERMLGNLDTDEDGRISADEFVDERTRQLEQLFNRRDNDGDGLLSAAESKRPDRRRGDRAQRRPAPVREAVQACIQPGDEPGAGDGPGNRADLFTDADRNGDGMLSLAELTETTASAAQTRFADLDDDGDGYITEAELTARAEAVRARGMELRECIRENRQRGN